MNDLTPEIWAELKQRLTSKTLTTELLWQHGQALIKAAEFAIAFPNAAGGHKELKAENERLKATLKEQVEKYPYFDRKAADALADEVAVLVRLKTIDARSPAGDALLDFRDPPSTIRADRIADLERQLKTYHSERQELRSILSVSLPSAKGTQIAEFDPSYPLVESAKLIVEQLKEANERVARLEDAIGRFAPVLDWLESHGETTVASGVAKQLRPIWVEVQERRSE